MRKIFNAAILLVVMASCQSKDLYTKCHVQPGDSLPEFSVITTDNYAVTSESLKGRPSIIIHFDTRCPDCRRQLPEIEAVHRAYGERIAVIAIARDQDTNEVQTYWRQEEFTMPAAAPGSRMLYNLFDGGSRSGIPQVYISDREGIVIRYADDKSILSAREISAMNLVDFGGN